MPRQCISVAVIVPHALNVWVEIPTFSCADPIVAVVNVINDTALAMRWVAPPAVLQQGVTAYYALVQSECFTSEQKGQQQNFTHFPNQTLEVIAGRLGKLVIDLCYHDCWCLDLQNHLFHIGSSWMQQFATLQYRSTINFYTLREVRIHAWMKKLSNALYNNFFSSSCLSYQYTSSTLMETLTLWISEEGTPLECHKLQVHFLHIKKEGLWSRFPLCDDSREWLEIKKRCFLIQFRGGL